MDPTSRLEALKRIADEVSECRRCSLWESRRNPVVGEGDAASAIVFIGEAPGYWEDAEGRPFVGSAGKLLNELLRRAGLSRERVYITNVVKCRPPGNRDPRPDEIAACGQYLDRQLDIIRPRVIVTLGRHSTAYIFSRAGLTFTSISDVQGRVFEARIWGSKTYIIPSYHPAAALYNASLRGYVERAIKVAADMLGAAADHTSG